MKVRISIGLAVFLLFCGASASAQLVQNSNEPIDITGDTAEFHENTAIWTGNVRITQGDSILTAERIEAELTEGGDFDTIHAIGSVRYSNGAEAITGDRAVFNDTARTITISENVLVTQGKQVLSAGIVTYWIDTGKVRFLPSAGKRIRGIFYTKSEENQL